MSGAKQDDGHPNLLQVLVLQWEVIMLPSWPNEQPSPQFSQHLLNFLEWCHEGWYLLQGLKNRRCLS